MKRDKNLLRDILRYCRQHSGGQSAELLLLNQKNFGTMYPDLTQDILDDHVGLLAESGLLRASPSQAGWYIVSLTSAGHDFLDKADVSEIWSAAVKAGGSLSFKLFSSVLDKMTEKYINSL